MDPKVEVDSYTNPSTFTITNIQPSKAYLLMISFNSTPETTNIPEEKMNMSMVESSAEGTISFEITDGQVHHYTIRLEDIETSKIYVFTQDF